MSYKPANLEVGEVGLAERALRDDGREGEHGQAAVGQLLQLVLRLVLGRHQLQGVEALTSRAAATRRASVRCAIR